MGRQFQTYKIFKKILHILTKKLTNMKVGIIITCSVLFICVVCKPTDYSDSSSSSSNVISSNYKAKNTRAILLQNYNKLSKIKNQRNRRVKMNILAARRALLNRQYLLQNNKNQAQKSRRRLT